MHFIILFWLIAIVWMHLAQRLYCDRVLLVKSQIAGCKPDFKYNGCGEFIDVSDTSKRDDLLKQLQGFRVWRKVWKHYRNLTLIVVPIAMIGDAVI